MVLLYFITLLGLTAAAVVPDFDSTQYYYELVYHATHHLLLAIHLDDCYYVNVPPGKEGNLIDDGGLIRNRLEITEDSLFARIRQSDGATPSSLDAVRDKYGDVLADFHCLDKTIYEVDLFSGAGSTHTTPIPHPDDFVCATHPDGAYVYAGDCRKYIQCVWGTRYIESCAPGTLFNAATKQCTNNPPCP